MYSPNDDPPGLPRTPYLDGGGPPLRAEPASGRIEAEIAVIGGGITGCSLALHAAQAGARVVVVEANEIGWGASGRNSGHVPPATKHEPQDLFTRYGAECGLRLFRASRAGPDLVFELERKHGMGASVSRSGVITAAHTRGGMATLERRTEFLAGQGYCVKLLDRDQTADLLGSNRRYYVGSSLDLHGGTINPLAFVRGLARAAISNGASVFERSRAQSLARGGLGWRVGGDGWELSASQVALCTNAYGSALWPGLASTVVPVRAYQFVSEPIANAVRPTVMPGREGMTDMRRLMSGIRVHSDGSLHFSGQGPLFGPERPPLLARSVARIRSIFPQVGNLQVAYWWSGWMAMNPQNAWQVHELAPGLVAALGCNGRGLAIATTLGRDLAAWFCGARADEIAIPPSAPRSIRLHRMREPLVRSLVTYYRLRDALETRR